MTSQKLFDLTGKVAVVTGGNGGIGLGIAMGLAGAGANIVIAARSVEKTAQALEDIRALGVEAHGITVDVTQEPAIQRMVTNTIDHMGRLDILVNNSGIAVRAQPQDLTAAQWDSVVDVNLTGAFLCTQEAFRIMKSQDPMGGRIINNGSISAYVPRPNSAPYSATKHAIAGLTKSTSLDGRKYDIACGQIDIGNAETGMAEVFKTGVPQANGTIAPEPTFDPEHVAQAVVYMASLPLDTNVQVMTVMATKMPYIGRG